MFSSLLDSVHTHDRIIQELLPRRRTHNGRMPPQFCLRSGSMSVHGCVSRHRRVSMSHLHAQYGMDIFPFIRLLAPPPFIRLSTAVSVFCPRISFYLCQSKTTHTKQSVLKGANFVGVCWSILWFLGHLQDCGPSGGVPAYNITPIPPL